MPDLKSRIRGLFSDALAYGFGNYLSKIVGFLLIPVYTRYFTTADYGILALVNVFGAILFVFLNMGQGSAIFRHYFDSQDPESKETVVSTGFRLILYVSLPLSLLVMFSSKQIASLLIGNPELALLVALTSAGMIGKEFTHIPFAKLRAERRAIQYAGFAVTRTTLSMGLSILFVVVFDQGILGVLLGVCIAEFVLCFLMYPSIIGCLKRPFSRKRARELLGYGLPFIPTGMAGFVLNLSDRFFLKHFATLDDVGLYALASRFGEGTWLLSSAFTMAWPAFAFEHSRSAEGPQLLGRVSTYYLAGMGFVWLGTSIFAKEAIMLMASSDFHQAYTVVPLLALGATLHGVVIVGSVGVGIKKQTIYLPVIVGLSALVNLALNYLWVPTYGMMGAAYATVVSFLIQCLLAVSISQKLYFVAYEYRRVLCIIGVSGSIFLGSTWIVNGSLGLMIAQKALLLCLYPVVLVVCGFLANDERRFIEARLGDLKRLAQFND